MEGNMKSQNETINGTCQINININIIHSQDSNSIITYQNNMENAFQFQNTSGKGNCQINVKIDVIPSEDTPNKDQSESTSKSEINQLHETLTNENSNLEKNMHANNGDLTDLSDQKPGGLKNTSSTCYMNAIIQAMASSNTLIKNLANMKKINPNCLSLTYLYDLLNAVNEPNMHDETLIRNTNLLEKLIESIKWSKPSQQDAFELLSALINGIHKDFKNIENFVMPMKVKMVHTFQGIKISKKIQEHLGLSLNLRKSHNSTDNFVLTFLIDNHFQPTKVDEDAIKTTKLILYQKAPDILLLHMQANKWNEKKGEMIKLKYKIVYEENMAIWLDIATDLNKEKVEMDYRRIDYHLKAIVEHIGSISTGHYITYRKWKNEWYLISDAKIEKTELNDNICPYIMIYGKIKSNET